MMSRDTLLWLAWLIQQQAVSLGQPDARDLVRAPLRMWRRERAERAALAAIVDAEDGIVAS